MSEFIVAKCCFCGFWQAFENRSGLSRSRFKCRRCGRSRAVRKGSVEGLAVEVAFAGSAGDCAKVVADRNGGGEVLGWKTFHR